MLDPSGEPKYFIKVIEDISQRKQAEEALRTSEQQYRLLAERVADGIGIIQEGKLVFVNEVLASMLGLPVDQLVGRSPVKLFQSANNAPFENLFKQLEQGPLGSQSWPVLCPNGCNLIEPNYPINGFPGLRIKFTRPEVKGEFVISAIEGDFDKSILSGTLEEGVKDELYCPHCGVMFAKLVSCNCQPDADMVVIGLTPQLDFNNAITFCNVTGCHNGAFVKSGDVLRHIRLYNV
jgi:hypothetical protein